MDTNRDNETNIQYLQNVNNIMAKYFTLLLPHNKVFLLLAINIVSEMIHWSESMNVFWSYFLTLGNFQFL